MNDDQKMGRGGIEPPTHGFSISQPNGALEKPSEPVAMVEFGIAGGSISIRGGVDFASRMLNAVAPEFTKIVRELATAAGQDPDSVVAHIEAQLNAAMVRATREAVAGEPVVVAIHSR